MNIEVTPTPYSKSNTQPLSENCLWLYTEEQMINYLEQCSDAKYNNKRNAIEAQ